MFEPYQPRRLITLGVEIVAGYQLKTYAILYGEAAFDTRRFSEALALAAASLPQPSVANERPGVGFVILHQGRTGDYLILCWWDRENELPTRVFLRGDDGWRPAAASESFCIWDLRVIWHEREAYVATVLAGGGDGVDAYLAATIEGWA